MKIHEVLGYGPIVANDEELDLLVTVNGSYFNLWVGDLEGNYNNTDCRALDAGFNGLHGMDITKVMDRAKQYLKDSIDLDKE